MKYLFYSIICLLLLCRSVMANDISDVENLLKERVDAIVLILHEKGLDQQDRNEKIIEIVRPAFDFRIMAKLSLGKKHWPGLRKEKRAEFIDLFTKRLEESYLEKLGLYTDEKVVYGTPQKVKKKIHMPTYMISKDSKISMLYKLYKSKTGWKIYDIEIQGVSVIQTYRSQFDGFLKNGTIDDLLEKWKTPDRFSIPNGE